MNYELPEITWNSRKSSLQLNKTTTLNTYHGKRSSDSTDGASVPDVESIWKSQEIVEILSQEESRQILDI